jgi:hypothetical protein
MAERCDAVVAIGGRRYDDGTDPGSRFSAYGAALRLAQPGFRMRRDRGTATEPGRHPPRFPSSSLRTVLSTTPHLSQRKMPAAAHGNERKRGMVAATSIGPSDLISSRSIS